MKVYGKAQKRERMYVFLAYTLMVCMVAFLIPTTDNIVVPLIRERIDWPLVLMIALTMLYPFIIYLRYGNAPVWIMLFNAMLTGLPAVAFLMFGVSEITGRLPVSDYALIVRFNWVLFYFSCVLTTYFFFMP